MAKYIVSLLKKAQKQLDKLSDKVALPIFDAIQSLEDNPRPRGCKKLKGREGYRIRIGDFRVIYEVFDHILLVDIITMGHRKTFTNKVLVSIPDNNSLRLRVFARKRSSK